MGLNYAEGEVIEKPVIQMELEKLYILPDPKRIQPNGTVYISTHFAGKRIKAVIFEEE